MLAYHDASADLDGIHRDYRSNYNGQQHHAKHLRQHKFDGLERSKIRRCLKKRTKFLFSYVRLVGLVAIYAVAGGFLFQLLEERQEKLNCREAQGQIIAQITQLKQNLLSYIQNNTKPKAMSSTNEMDNKTVAFAKIGSMLHQYREFIIRTSSKYRVNRDNCSIVNKWTYPNSLVFAITIMTTIGYGHLTPMTWEGQICCICFATIGIPIFLVCVANIGDGLGQIFRFLSLKIIYRPWASIKKRRAKARKDKLEKENGINTTHAPPSGETLNDDDNKTTPGKRLSNSMVTDDEEELRKNRHVSIPLTVTMVFIVLYILIGSVLFHHFEGWTMIQAAYFCFTTLATIGFGDFIPGQRKDDINTTPKLILGAIYVLFGMAILAMGFELMQEEIVAKFRWIGTKTGIARKHDGNNDQTDKVSDTKNKKHSSTNDPNPNHSIVDNESSTDSPTPRNSSATCKTSPRNNIARVHPMETNPSNEVTLHQRISSIKSD